MPTIDELLNDNSDIEEYEHGFAKADGYMTAPYTDAQVIYITNKSIGDLSEQISVEGESNSQYILFERDRFADGIDLVNKLIQVHYEREDSVADNCPVVNVEYSEDKLRFGWVIPEKAVAIDGVLRVMPFVYGTDPNGDTYVMKDLYAEYDVNEGMAIDGGIEEPEEQWYQQFLDTMQQFLDQSVSAKNAAAGSESNAAQSAEQAAASEESAAASAGAASAHELNAQSARDVAVESASQAKRYYENTKQLSMASVGDVVISIDAERRCLVAQYMESDEEELPNDWYTDFLAQISAWLEQAQGSALAAGNSEAAAEEYMENAQNSASQATSANTLAQQAAEECLSASGQAQAAANAAKTYFEQTKALSVSSMGEITFGINGARKCLTATYDESNYGN